MTESHDAGLDAFLEAVKSGAPTPGGGAVAGLCGALGAALAHMVGSLTVGKKKYAGVAADFVAAMPEMDAAMRRFRELMTEDVAAFEGYMAAFRMPRVTDEAKAERRAALREATIHAAEIPLRTLEHCRAALPLVRIAAEKGNRHAVSDAGIAALLLTCAAKAAAMNVKINLAGLEGEDHERVARRLEAALAPTLEEAAALEKLVYEGL